MLRNEKSAPMSDSQLPRVDPQLLEFLVCPVTKSALRYDAEKAELISDKAHLAFPVRDGVPVMLESEARRIAERDDPAYK